jgi:hypothetical protein
MTEGETLKPVEGYRMTTAVKLTVGALAVEVMTAAAGTLTASYFSRRAISSAVSR